MDDDRLAQIKKHDAVFGEVIPDNQGQAKDRRDLLDHMAGVWREGFEQGLLVACIALEVPKTELDAALETHPPVEPYRRLGETRKG